MNSIIISVKVPGSGRTFEIKVSPNIFVGELTSLLINAFENLTDEDFNPVNSVLCDITTGQILDINMTLGNLGIVNGTGLLLI